MKKLRDLYIEHSGKASDKWNLYLDEYDRIFSDVRSKPISILEIGVQNGGSLELWAKYFDGATDIVGCDINADCRALVYDDPRVTVVIGNANSDEVEFEIGKVCGEFDVVIDDGSHTSSDIVKSFARYFPKVKQGGIFIAEDLHCSYWKDFEGGLYDPHSSIQFFKYLADIVNHEHWGIEKTGEQYLNIFEDRYGVSFEDSHLGDIHSVEFVNSMCVIRKLPRLVNQLGSRLVTGNDFQVVPAVEGLNGINSQAPSQVNNNLANRDTDPISEITAKNRELEEKNRSLDEFLLENQTLAIAITGLKQEISVLDLDVLTLKKELAEREKTLEELALHVDQLRRSTSWMITSPLRWCGVQLKILRELGLKRRARQIIERLLKMVLLPLLGAIRKRPRYKFLILKIVEKVGLQEQLFSLYHKCNHISTGGSERLSQSASTSYRVWSQNFDTPTAEDEERLRNTSNPHREILVVARFDDSSVFDAVSVAKSLVDSVGQSWKALFIFCGISDEAAWVSKISEEVGRDQRFSFGELSESYTGPLLLIDGAVELRRHGLRIFADTVHGAGRPLLAYSDEDSKARDGDIYDPWFKPEYSPILAQQGRLFGRVVAFSEEADVWGNVQTHIVRGNCNLREFVIGKAAEVAEQDVVHIPHVLFRNLGAALSPLDCKNPDLTRPPSVSIVIPTRDRWDLLGPCLKSIRASAWPAEKLDIIVLDNGSQDKETLRNLSMLVEEGLITVIRDELPFNWARLNNLAANSSDAELLIFLNNDTEVDDPEWISKLACYAMQPTVGAVGCKLLYPDRTVQHGGVIAGIQGVAGHGHLFIGAKDGGYCDLANTTREVSAVTGACLAVERSKYQLVGGFNEDFPVAFNDVIFCFDLIKNKFKNIYLADALLIHHESKSRGYDDTPEKVRLNREAAMRAWLLHPDIMRSDPYYSPNLSLCSPYALSEAPRRKYLWRSSVAGEGVAKKVLLLSCTHSIGHGVPAVLALQADYLVRSGFEVIVGGPRSDNDFPYPGCGRIEVHDPLEALAHATSLGVDVIIPHTPPFFSVSRWSGNYPVTICYDHGEPPADWFPDADRRKELLAEKDFALTMASHVYAISEAIADESRTRVNGVIPEGNTHLGAWGPEAADRRLTVRQDKGWDDCFIVLDVCRFHRGERIYKGVDKYALVLQRLLESNPELKGKVKFVLCGKGSAEDVREMEREGLTVFANVTNEEMFELYTAADAYMNFSRWEGFNLGVAQALAMGLPTLASDIPAHRAFQIPVTNDERIAADWVIKQLEGGADRVPRLIEWDKSLRKWVDLINDVVN